MNRGLLQAEVEDELLAVAGNTSKTMTMMLLLQCEKAEIPMILMIRRRRAAPARMGMGTALEAYLAGEAVREVRARRALLPRRFLNDCFRIARSWKVILATQLFCLTCSSSRATLRY